MTSAGDNTARNRDARIGPGGIVIPQSIAVVSGKGGTGKSILVASLGYVLARCGFRVLLIDTDFYTFGLSYFLMGGKPYLVNKGASTYLLPSASQKEQGYSYDCDMSEGVDSFPLEMKDVYRNLELLAVAPDLDRKQLEQKRLPSTVMDLVAYVERLQKFLQEAVSHGSAAGGFDYVLLDTRGATEPTTLGAALAADGFLLVSEADSTAWNVSALFQDTIKERTRLLTWGTESRFRQARLGFILNKNTLEQEDELIRLALEKLRSRPLAVIPLDLLAARSYQSREIPVSSSLQTPFSCGVLEVTEKLFQPGGRWEADAREMFQKMRETSRTGVQTTSIEVKDKGEETIYSVALFLLAVALGIGATLANVLTSLALRAVLAAGSAITLALWLRGVFPTLLNELTRLWRSPKDRS